MSNGFPIRYDIAPLARLETNWVPPWLIARVAQHGPMHFRRGEPMDDHHIIGSAAGAFWMVAADGVGSKRMSRFGSEATCRAVDAFLGDRLLGGAVPSRQLLSDAFKAAHEAIQARARQDRADPLDYCTTLCAVLVRGNDIVAASVGDSSLAIGTRKGKGEGEGQAGISLAALCSGPQPSRATYTIADPNWAAYLATSESRSPHVDLIIAATDGANGFFLDHAAADQNIFRTAWVDHLDERLATLGPLTFVNLFAAFILNQPSENDDDRTLLIAFRPPPNIAPPAAKPR